MKKPCSKRHHRVGKAVGAVSAAALMLGVSPAATVGFNFQANYCVAAAYSGAFVTAPAFGIGTKSWESLAQMETGIGCPDGVPTGPYSLNETINTTTSTNGLNPLPNGSLTVAWSAFTANVSGFGGYGRPGPRYDFVGPGYSPNPGNEQVYWGFLRDGVNFGPGSTNGDNNQPGYTIDITGLKSVFTNTPFVVQLVASSDSMQYLTNAFIIDATHSTTQSVFYPGTPMVGSAGGTGGWLRGVGGGLSTMSAPVNADHVQITGARARHSAGPPAFNFAGTIAGFIITDQPVVTMSPQPVVVGPGDSVTLNPYAIGVPPLSYQWLLNGRPLAGAINSSFALPKPLMSDGGIYSLVVSNQYGAAVSSNALVTVDSLLQAPVKFVVDSKPSGTEHDGIDLGAKWLATDSDGTTTRTGIARFAASDPDQIAVPPSPDFDSGNGTIAFWMRSSGAATNSANGGATLYDQLTGGNGLLLVQSIDGRLLVEIGNDTNQFESSATISDDQWHHIVVTYDQSAAGKTTLYVDGAQDSFTFNLAAWSWPAGEEIELGLSHDPGWGAYTGLMDDVRIYSRILTPAEIQTVFAGDALVDTNTLKLRLDFNTAPLPGFILSWQLSDAVLQSADAASGPYTDLPSAVSPYSVSAQAATKFYRYRRTTPPQAITSNPYLM